MKASKGILNVGSREIDECKTIKNGQRSTKDFLSQLLAGEIANETLKGV